MDRDDWLARQRKGKRPWLIFKARSAALGNRHAKRELECDAIMDDIMWSFMVEIVGVSPDPTVPAEPR